MLATPTLNQHVVPLLLEKLSAKQIETKTASLQMLGQIAQRFTLQELVDPAN